MSRPKDDRPPKGYYQGTEVVIQQRMDALEHQHMDMSILEIALGEAAIVGELRTDMFEMLRSMQTDVRP